MSFLIYKQLTTTVTEENIDLIIYQLALQYLDFYNLFQQR